MTRARGAVRVAHRAARSRDGRLMRSWLRHHAQSLAGRCDASSGNRSAAPQCAGHRRGTRPAARRVRDGRDHRAMGSFRATEPEMSVFLDLDAARADVDRIQASSPNCRRAGASLRAKDKALAEIGKTRSCGHRRALKRNPLPDAFVLRLAPDAVADEAAERARRIGRVAKVQLDAAWSSAAGAPRAWPRGGGRAGRPSGVDSSPRRSTRSGCNSRPVATRSSQPAGRRDGGLDPTAVSVFRRSPRPAGAAVAVAIVAVAAYYLTLFWGGLPASTASPASAPESRSLGHHSDRGRDSWLDGSIHVSK